MLPLALLPATLDLDHSALDGSTVTLFLHTTSATAACPACGQVSSHVHSRYLRRLGDLPLQGRTTRLELTVRRFFCRNLACPRKVFGEPLPDLASPHARSTSRLTEALRAIALSLGGEAGSRLASKLAMPTSPDTLLRRIKQASATAETTPPPRVVGVDDWALRRGHNYGTILVDLQRGRVIDLLPGRDGSGLREWLTEHPGIEVISRDRASAYAQAAKAAAPNAVQVADRWHLLKNLREMLERFLERRRPSLQAVSSQLARLPAPLNGPHQPRAAESEAVAVGPPPDATPQAMVLSPGEQARQARRQQRQERHQQVRQLHGQGRSIRQIAKEVGLSRNVVRRYLRQEHCPDWRPGQPRPNRLGRFAAWIDQQLEAEPINAAQLHQSLAGKGYAGSYDAVRRYVARRLAALGKERQRANAAGCRHPVAPSARDLAFGLIKAPQQRTVEAQAQVAILRGINGEFQEVLALSEEFAAMLRKQSGQPLTGWLEKAAGSASAELRGFAEGVRQDEAAVGAAISEPWSNGSVEGQINRLKLIKRQMFGRAGFELLRRRVLHRG